VRIEAGHRTATAKKAKPPTKEEKKLDYDGSLIEVDFVAAKSSKNHEVQQLSTSSVQQVQYQSVKSINFNRIQQGFESGSGPGGRRFESSSPTIYFQSLTSLPECLKNPAVGKNATLFSWQIFYEDIFTKTPT
jgi:hypothetical protein